MNAFVPWLDRLTKRPKFMSPGPKAPAVSQGQTAVEKAINRGVLNDEAHVAVSAGRQPPPVLADPV